MDKDAYYRLTGYLLIDAKDNWKSLCPIHVEKSPSFFIHKHTYLSHCFGCGVSGYIVDILAKEYGMSRPAVLKTLGVPLTNLGPWKPRVEEQFNRAFLAGFKRISTHPFLKKRGFKTDTITLHGARWDPAGRIVFPLTTVGNPNILGAAGRTVKNDPKKWHFYSNTSKGNIVYQALDTLELSIIVEGIFDVMWLNQHGYIGAGALLGAVASRHQIETIKRSTDEVILFLDNDEAGRIGQEKLAKALKSSVRVTYAKYPNGKKDPQELSKEELDTAITDRETYVQQHASI